MTRVEEILNWGCYAILTADNPYHSGRFEQVIDAEKRWSILKDYTAHLETYELQGYYESPDKPEHSLLIVNPNPAVIRQLALDLGQDTFIYGFNNFHMMLNPRNPATTITGLSVTWFDADNQPEQFYSIVKETGQAFTINFDWG